MFIFPPFNKILLRYASSKQSDTNVGEPGPADFLGARNEQDNEHVRLYRALARRIERNGLVGLRTETPLAIEIQRWYEKNSDDPQSIRKMRDRMRAPSNRKMISRYVRLLLCDQDADGKFCDYCEEILDRIDQAEEIAVRARLGRASVDDLFRMPWILLGAKVLPRQDESEDARVERLVSCDVVLFLWVLALLGSHGAWKACDIRTFVPDRSEKLGECYFLELEHFAKYMRKGETRKVGRPARYRFVATFLVSGDPDGGPMEALADELSAIARGKKRLTKGIIDRHVQLLAEAISINCNGCLSERAGDLALMVHTASAIIGFLQYAREVGLSEVRKKNPAADINSAFDAGLACWPSLVELVRA